MKNWKNLKHLTKSNKLDISKQYELLESMSVFLIRGYSVYETVKLLNNQFHLEKMILDLEEGAYLSEVFLSYNFDLDVLLIIEIAEKSGNLNEGILKAMQLLKGKKENKEQIMELLKYPILLAVVLVVALGFVGLFLIPQFRSIYDSFGMDLQLGVLILFGIIHYAPIITIILIAVILMIYIYITTLPFKKQMQVYFKYEISKKYFVKLYNQIFVINFTNLLSMGLKIDDILKIFEKQTYNKLLKIEAKRILKELNDGKLFYETVDNVFYSEELKLLIKDGETQSTLLHNLENYIIFIERVNKSRSQKMLFMIQPIFYSIFGGLIILLYGSIFIPMFQMMETL